MASKTASAFQVHSAPPAGYQHGPASPQDAWNHMQDRSGVRGTASHQQPVQQPAQQQQQRQPYNQQPPMAYQSLVQQPRPIPSEWQEGYCECFSPLSLGLKAGCCPCVVYGKTHHRLRNDGDMSQYDCCNVSCMIYVAALHFGMNWIPVWLQRSDLRNKHNLQGNGYTDCLSACCCPMCDMVQVEKESQRLELEQDPGNQALGYQPHGNMVATNKN